MSDRHVLAQASHSRHLVGVYCVDDTTGTKEEASLEHSVCEQVEHGSHVAERAMSIDNLMVSRQANAKCNHHKGNLRDCRECEHTLDVALCTGNGCCIESGEYAYPHDDAHLTGSILYPQREETCYLEHTSNNHGSGMDERTDRCRTLHGIGKPNVQWEHG